MAQVRPTWLHEVCPPWCSQEHAESDHPEDRRHTSVGTVIAAVVQDYEAESAHARASDIAVVLTRRVGQAATWLFIGETEGDRHRLTLSLESARAVAQIVDATLAATRSDPG